MAKLVAKLQEKEVSARALLFLKLSVDFGLRFYLIYGLCSLWGSFVGTHEVPTLFAFEDKIPFIPEMSWVYLSISLLMGVSPFVLDERGLHELNRVLRKDLVCAGIFFFLYPTNCSSLVLQAREQASGFGFALADFLNLENNMLPSLHVAFATSVALICSRGQRRWFQLVLFFWALAIAASTLLVHQHRLLDVVSGCALGLFSGVDLRPRSEKIGRR